MRELEAEEAHEPVSTARGMWRPEFGIAHLNHGSFGLAPLPVLEELRRLESAMSSNPMRFFDREYEVLWFAARERMARFLGCDANDLVFVENATHAMNVVADSVDLPAGSLIAFTDHEYGAVERIWARRAAERNWRTETFEIPLPLESAEQFRDALLSRLPDECRALVVSHITSATAIRFPIEAIAEELRRREILLIVDGPHAPAQIPLDVGSLGADFYAASCHKWLAAPLGTGFLYVDPRGGDAIRSPLMSWGRLMPARPTTWQDEFIWPGTKNLCPNLCVPAAIDLMAELGLPEFRSRTRKMAGAIRDILLRRWRTAPISPWTDDWQLSMSLVPLPPGRDYAGLKRTLAIDYNVEIPVVLFRGAWYVRVSCHWYTTVSDFRRLLAAFDTLGL